MLFSRFQRLVVACLCWNSVMVAMGFAPTSKQASSRRLVSDSDNLTVMAMAKKMRNKQAELAKKMAMAKKQKAEKEGTTQDQDEKKRLTDAEMKEMNDRKRFGEMLEKQSLTMNSVSSDGYLSREQEEEEINAYSEFRFVV